MDGYIVRKKSIDCYLSYLQSSDSRTIIMALQELFFDVEKGKLFAYYERRKIEEELIRIITTDTDARVRQWCYMLGSFLKSPKLVSICKKKFEQEVPKNKTWILALLSHNLDTKEFLIIRKQAENFLSKDTINLSTYLFSNYQYEHLDSSYVRNVMKQDDNLAMLWFGWIATCRNQNLRYQKQELLTHEQMSEITQYDDDNILKHITAAYSRRDNVNVSELQFDIFDYKNMQPEHKKWFLTTIWKDKLFIKENLDYIRELLSLEHLFKQCDKRVREGLARGLSTYDFEQDLIRNILEWMSYERETSVRYFLLTYVLRHENNCEDFQEVIYSELMSDNESAKQLIYSYKSELFKDDNYGQYIVIVGGDLFMGDNFTGDKIYGSKYVAGQVGNQGPEAGTGSTITQIYIEEKVDGDCGKLLDEIAVLTNHLRSESGIDSDERDILIGKLAEAKREANKNDYSGAVEIIKKIGKELYIIARTIGCSLIASLIKNQTGIIP